mgnify:FL=1
MIKLPTVRKLLLAASPFHRVSALLLSRTTWSLPAVLAVLLATFLLLLGCGYHFAGTGGQAPGDIQSINVNVMRNQTAEIGIVTIFTNAILNEFIRWKRLEVKPANEA